MKKLKKLGSRRVLVAEAFTQLFCRGLQCGVLAICAGETLLRSHGHWNGLMQIGLGILALAILNGVFYLFASRRAHRMGDLVMMRFMHMEKFVALSLELMAKFEGDAQGAFAPTMEQWKEQLSLLALPEDLEHPPEEDLN